MSNFKAGNEKFIVEKTVLVLSDAGGGISSLERLCGLRISSAAAFFI